MKATLKLATFAALLAFGGLTAQAQEATGFDTQFKMRVGTALASPKDELNPRMFGFGVEVGYTTSFGRFGLEAGYQYIPGSQYLTDLSRMETATGATIDPDYSVESKKNRVEGLMGRLSYEYGFAGTDWALRVGAQVGGARFRHEYIGDIGDTGWATYEDTYNGTPTKSAVAVSPFAGVRYSVNEFSAIEVNLIGIAYKSIDYRHVAGTVPGSWEGNTGSDYLVEKNRMAPHLEFAYVFRF